MLFTLLGLPVTGPIGGLRFILEQLRTMAERELYDEDRIREELLLLQFRLQEGEITEEEYVAQETDIIARLRAAREYHRGSEEFGMQSWGTQDAEHEFGAGGEDPGSNRGKHEFRGETGRPREGQ